ncbi:MAG: hypothetical protein RIE84_04950 [Parvibaculum sp.]|uniref:hypothetical protein n=1 Tax=Parvibaculum sp. TaxID=2024848 RepID=UPI0032EF2E93
MTEERGFTMDEIMARRFPVLPADIAVALDQISPSDDGGVLYYPCSVRMKDGIEFPHVYFVEARSWLVAWAPLPDRSLDKNHLDVRHVAEVQECPDRLPPAFANRLYEAGESGMGYTIFTLRFSDGSRAVYSSGNVVDFVIYPDGKSAADVIDVIPHEGKEDSNMRLAPVHRWCIFELPEMVS